jgi:5-(carboxyamino)imidazole ribonucleotide mutase
MPAGIPVATVAIGNAQNAGLLAVQILAAQRPELLEQVVQFRKGLAEMVQNKQTRLAELGVANYLIHQQASS